MRVTHVEAARRHGLLLLCFLAGARALGPATSGGDEPPHGKLLLRPDAAAELSVDGQHLASLAPGQVRVLTLTQGRHRVALASAGGEARWEETVEVKPTQAVRLVGLADTVRRVRQGYVRIPSGRFEMGCVGADPSCAPDEKPRHPVTIGRDFWMMRTEVTVRDYEGFAAAARREMPAAPPFNAGWKWKTHPIVGVAWADAAAYCERDGGRLPTEAEWEYAARAGVDGRRYVWGDGEKPVRDGYKMANVADQRAKGAFAPQDGQWFADYDDGYSYTSPAFQYTANEFGLFDMAGNVWEWCADRVLRGGSWATGAGGARVSKRLPSPSGEAREDAGIRCARDLMRP
jgi:formylglycine-generating enzyme required for sulfatase activity